MSETDAKKGMAGGRPGVLPARRRFSADEYHRMADAGILGPEERVELLEGDIYTMAAIGSRHARCVDTLAEWLIVRLAGRAIVRIQGPVRLSSGLEPEPDLALLRPRADRYGEEHPGPGDLLLLIEVADTSLAYDRDLKLPRYAEAGIPEVWLVDLTANQVLIHRDPSGPRYASVSTAGRGDTLTPAAFPDLRLPIDDLLLG